VLSSADYARAYLCLVRWRYLFIPVPEEALHFFALESASSPPGPELREIHRYMIECMRSDGVQLDPVTKPPPDGLFPRWYLLSRHWSDAFMSLLFRVWGDEKQFTDDDAKSFTEWILLQCVPSPPDRLPEEQRAALANSAEGEPLFLKLLLSTLDTELPPRGRQLFQYAMQLLHGANADERYWETLIRFGQMLHAEAGAGEYSPEAAIAMFRHVLAETAPEEQGRISIPISVLSEVESLTGLNLSGSPKVGGVRNQVDQEKKAEGTIAVSGQPASGHIECPDEPQTVLRGPIVITEQGTRTTVSLPHCEVLAPDPKVRENALARVRRTPDGVPAATAPTLAVLAVTEPRLMSLDPRVRQAAAKLVVSALLHDFRYCRFVFREIGHMGTAGLAEEVDSVLQGVLLPDMRTVTADVPAALGPKWSRDGVPDEALAAAKSVLESPTPVRDFIDRTGLALAGGRCGFSGAAFLVVGSGGDGAKTLRLCAQQVHRELVGVREPVQASGDVAVALHGIEFLLRCRAAGVDAEPGWFAEPFGNLLLAMLRGGGGAEDTDRLLSSCWSFMHKAIAWYLLSLDLDGTDTFPDAEQRVAVAVWLAWSLRAGIRQMAGRVCDNQPDLAAYVDRWRERVERLSTPLWLRYYSKLSPLDEPRHAILHHSDLLQTMVINSLGEYKDTDGGQSPAAITASAGLSSPSKILPPEVRDCMIDISWRAALSRGGYISENPRQSVLPWRFCPSANAAVPPLLRDYYGASFEYLGKARTEQIAMVEGIPSCLQSDLAVSPLAEHYRLGHDGTVGVAVALAREMALRGEPLPEPVKTFLADLSRNPLVPDAARTAQIGVALHLQLACMLPYLAANEHGEDARLVGNLLLSAAPGQGSDADEAALREMVAENVVFAVVFGADELLLERLLAGIGRDRKTAQGLSRIRDALLENIRELPPPRRDRLRRVLSILASVSP
jgi:hypothetical protein